MKKNLLITLLIMSTITLCGCAKEEVEAPVVETEAPVVETVEEVEIEKVEEEIVLSPEVQAELDQLAEFLELTDEEIIKVKKLIPRIENGELSLLPYDDYEYTGNLQIIMNAAALAGIVDNNLALNRLETIKKQWAVIDEYDYTVEDFKAYEQFTDGLKADNLEWKIYTVKEMRMDKSKLEAEEAAIRGVLDYLRIAENEFHAHIEKLVAQGDVRRELVKLAEENPTTETVDAAMKACEETFALAGLAETVEGVSWDIYEDISNVTLTEYVYGY